MLKFTLVRTSEYLQTLIQWVRGYLPEIIFFIEVSYLPLNFSFVSCCCYKINETPRVLIAVI